MSRGKYETYGHETFIVLPGGSMPHDRGDSYLGPPRDSAFVDLYVRGSGMILEHTIEHYDSGPELYVRLSSDAISQIWGTVQLNIAKRLELLAALEDDLPAALKDFASQLRENGTVSV